ncbi:glycine cleavage system H protein, putative [Plasmodium ovale wallikeri]|uniref:Glycine cleavage system H protein, putative n=2 Tax=Plasmodium ovale TaxID=36330 RepID=A0A1A8YWQ5_PLAOA|nr:glycine cleavage system H protein, putative [Plasmodium ovale wallikeri]SBT36038.1 glycine cleavage system H protein, putative [Plasmodium ovale wallikeri]
MLSPAIVRFSRSLLRMQDNSPYLQIGRRGFTTYYTKTHEYIRIKEGSVNELKNKSGVKCKIGISNYGTEKLGEIVYIDVTHNINDYVKKGDCIATIESVKSVGDVYTPISGKIININSELIDNINLMNENPESSGWIMELLTNDINDKEIMDISEYKKICQEEEQKEETTLKQNEINCLEEKNKNKMFDLNDVKSIENREGK